MLFAGFRAVDAVVATLPDWAAAIGVVLRVALVVLLLVATGFVLVRIGVVVGSPWYGRLSRRIEAIEGLAAPPEMGGFLRDVARSLGYEAKKLSLVVGVGLGLLLLNVVPLAGSGIAAVGGVALAATVAGLDFLDHPLERRRFGFRQKLGYLRRGLPGTAGFGLACVALTSVPILNLLAVPLCVAAGALFFCDRTRRGEG
jgi:CysZ protein